MTDRIDYFIAEAEKFSKKDEQSLFMVRWVHSVFWLEGRGYLVVLEEGLRDEEEGFDFVSDAVKRFRFVKAVKKHVRTLDYSSAGVDCLNLARKTLQAHRPKPDSSTADFGQFATEIRDWDRVQKAMVEAGVVAIRP
jgi:hypothetical protein